MEEQTTIIFTVAQAEAIRRTLMDLRSRNDKLIADIQKELNVRRDINQSPDDPVVKKLEAKKEETAKETDVISDLIWAFITATSKHDEDEPSEITLPKREIDIITSGLLQEIKVTNNIMDYQFHTENSRTMTIPKEEDVQLLASFTDALLAISKATYKS